MLTVYPTVHPFHSDGVADFYGVTRCPFCGLDPSHSVHDVRPPDEDAAALDARILGERAEPVESLT
jgi:hypothetical protein